MQTIFFEGISTTSHVDFSSIFNEVAFERLIYSFFINLNSFIQRLLVYSSFTRRNMEVQRHTWQGTYKNVDVTLKFLKDMPTVTFFLVYSLEPNPHDSSSQIEVLNMIPTTWMSDDNKTFLYPPLDFLPTSPTNWSNRTFQRNCYPQSSWIEYKTEKLAIAKSSRYYLYIYIFCKISLK